ncbi:hypothetical protein ACFCZ1_15475 [Streptomyces sp. NPDC056224]|uniref:hypothetical protein n=1 Tax=Streptomyces sp. NPDC056224 TaxID=3345750 RepID=UPI0035DB286F
MSPDTWKTAGLAAITSACIITAAFLVVAARAARKRAPRDHRPRLSFSAPVAAASVLGTVLGALATDRTLHLGMDELKTLLIPLTTGHAADALLRSRSPRHSPRPWSGGYAAATCALLIGTVVSGATTYLGA